MDFGIPTLLDQSIEACAALCRELGFHFIELSMDLPEYQPDRIDTLYFSKIADKYGIYYTIHAEGNLNPCDFNPRVAKAYTDTMLYSLKIAEKLSAPIVNMHFNQGEYFTQPDKKVYLYEKYSDEYQKKLIAFRDICTDVVLKSGNSPLNNMNGNTGIKICIENTSSFQLDFVKDSIELMLESPVFSLTFDTGHNAGRDFQHFPFIEKHIDRLCHMHLHDYSKSRGDHLPLGQGGLDIKNYLKLAEEHNCRVLLETKTAAGIRMSADWLKSNYSI